MRERITFIHGSEESFDPKQLRVEKDAFHVTDLRAAREDRVTFGFQELPQELWRALKQCHELHIRWASSRPFDSVSPFNSRTSPGLSIFYTPQKTQPDDLICPLIKKIFGDELKCSSPNRTFTPIHITSERFSSSSSHQYYTLLSDLNSLHTYVLEKICKNASPSDVSGCTARASALLSASTVDIDYDSISQAIVIKTLRHSPKPWTTSINPIGDAKLEIGVLSSQPATEQESLSLGGFLTVLNEDTKPSPTLFSFPARHHVLPTNPSSRPSYRTSFIHPTGLHPTLRLTFPISSTAKPPHEDICALHTYLVLPSVLFPDKYQLSSPLFLASKNLAAIRSVAGETDLEAPDWAISKWGSSMLLELAPPTAASLSAKGEYEWHADIPLHLRYLAPSPTGSTDVDIPWPVVFWACRAEEGHKMATNPFDRVNLGYDGLFGPKTMFYHFSSEVNASTSVAETGTLLETLSVPVLNSSHSSWKLVEPGTAFVIGIGFLWVLWKLAQVLLGVGRYSGGISGKKSQ